MSPQMSPNLRVNVGSISEIIFKLTLAGVHESVTVSAEPKQVETEPRGLSAVVDEKAILNLSLGHRYIESLCLVLAAITEKAGIR